jgi:hypothetical protein
MRSNLAFIAQRVGLNLAESGTDVLVSWMTWPVNSAVDPVTQSRTGKPTAMSMTVKAFLHFPQPSADSAVRQFNEIELGDCIADFHQDVQLDGLDKLEFVFLKPDGTPIDNQKWVTKPTGEKLAQSWNVVLQGQRLYRPVLLRKAT